MVVMVVRVVVVALVVVVVVVVDLVVTVVVVVVVVGGSRNGRRRRARISCGWFGNGKVASTMFWSCPLEGFPFECDGGFKHRPMFCGGFQQKLLRTMA